MDALIDSSVKRKLQSGSVHARHERSHYGEEEEGDSYRNGTYILYYWYSKTLKLVPPQYNWNIVESGVKTLIPLKISYTVRSCYNAAICWAEL